jgi:DNA-binding transcriptional LysR family regulator
MPAPDGVRREPVGQDRCEVLVPSGHPLAARASLVREDLVGFRWVCQPPGTVCHDWLHSTLRAVGQEPDVAYYIAEYDTQIALVAAGLGIALLPRLGRGPLPDGVELRPLEPTPTRRLFAVWRAGVSRRPAVAAAVRALREAAPPAG